MHIERKNKASSHSAVCGSAVRYPGSIATRLNASFTTRRTNTAEHATRNSGKAGGLLNAAATATAHTPRSGLKSLCEIVVTKRTDQAPHSHTLASQSGAVCVYRM